MYTISGEVQHGQKRGRELGYPTANIKLSQPIPEGIYISTTNIPKLYNQKARHPDNEIMLRMESNQKTISLPSLTFIGAAKTFDQTEVIAETYILDFDEDIYGTSITITLLKKIRDNQKFETVEKLKEQMKQDEEEAREYFKQIKSA